jgi:hypothetical protein
MALKSNNTAVAIAIQSVAGTFTTPTQPAALMPVSNLSLGIESVNIANDEYTGSPARNADQVAGKNTTLSYTVKLRPPGGGTVPAANAFLLGLILQAAKMNEVRSATAVPVAAEAGTAGTTTSLTLGTGAAATVNAYRGMAISLTGQGATYKSRMTAIRSYTAAKVATFAEAFAAPVTGTYQIPPQLGYMRDVTAADPIILSHSVWLDGHRYDLMDSRLTSLQIVVPTTTKDAAAYPEINVSYDVIIAADAAQATPAVPGLGAIPFYKDGKASLANVKVGLQTFTLDLGLTTETPPNPNFVDGNELSEIVSSTATMSMTRQKYLPAVLNSLALADAQAYHAFLAQWGNAAGNFVQIVVTDGRLDYQNPDLGGGIIMENGNLLIDALDRAIAINFTY